MIPEKIWVSCVIQGLVYEENMGAWHLLCLRRDGEVYEEALRNTYEAIGARILIDIL